MKITDLDARFLKVDPSDPRTFWTEGISLAEADGVMFLCPKCFAAAGTDVGVHSIICWFVGKVPDTTEPRPGRWVPSGTGVNNLTFIGPAAASVLLTGGGCQAHFFVRDGAIVMC